MLTVTLAHMDEWLSTVERRLREESPALLSIFKIYADEARFGRTYIDKELQRLNNGESILEVGAGAMLLSCQLVREGFNVTALEPTGEGFSHFSRMRDLVLCCADKSNCRPNIIEVPAEALSISERFSFAFSINVMEHVDSVRQSILNVGRSLKPGAKYRFTCPNYLFPYEPHFNIPTLFSKRLTEKVLKRQIFAAAAINDPAGTWQSLNWINVLEIKKYVRSSTELQVSFNRCLLVETLERVGHDAAFAARRSSWMRSMIGLLVQSRLHQTLKLIPAAAQPIIDCSIVKIKSS